MSAELPHWEELTEEHIIGLLQSDSSRRERLMSQLSPKDRHIFERRCLATGDQPPLWQVGEEVSLKSIENVRQRQFRAVRKIKYLLFAEQCKQLAEKANKEQLVLSQIPIEALQVEPPTSRKIRRRFANLFELTEKRPSDLRVFLTDRAIAHVQGKLEIFGLRMKDEPKIVDLFPLKGRPELLDQPIEALRLSTRTRKCLVRRGWVTIGDVLRCTSDDLLGTRNFGETSLQEVRQALHSLDLKLRNE